MCGRAGYIGQALIKNCWKPVHIKSQGICRYKSGNHLKICTFLVFPWKYQNPDAIAWFCDKNRNKATALENWWS